MTRLRFTSLIYFVMGALAAYQDQPAIVVIGIVAIAVIYDCTASIVEKLK